MVWLVEYEAGELTARAPGAADTLSTPEEAVQLRIRADRTALRADGLQVLQLEAALLDAADRPARDEVIRCQILGDLALMGLENGRPDDLTAYSEPFRLTREGTLTAYFRAGRAAGTASIHFRTDSGLHAVQKIRLVPEQDEQKQNGRLT